MQIKQDHFIYELSAETILSVLIEGAWKVENQSVTSAATNDNCLPEPNSQWLEQEENTAGINAFYDLPLDDNVSVMVDFGGGRFDVNKDYMQKKNIELLVWDPYNRTQAHNERVKQFVLQTKVKAVSSMSVLNVIPEVEVRLMHLATLKAALIPYGKAYIKIWPGEGSFKGLGVPTLDGDNYQANAKATRFLREVELVFGGGNANVHATVPNLIIAENKPVNLATVDEVVAIQEQERQDYRLQISKYALTAQRDTLFRRIDTSLDLVCETTFSCLVSK